MSREGFLWEPYRDGDQQARAVDLAHVRDRSGRMRLEPSGDLPALPDNANPSIVGAEEQTVRACAQAGDLIALEELSCFVVGERDLRHVEEVERLPLFRKQSGPSDEGGE